MADRIVKIKLDADATGAVRGFASVRDAAAEAKTKMHESARSQRGEWSTVGTGLTAVGVAITGVGVAALKTGIQYNTLQQTTRAALSTLLGSAQEANAQMDKLDDFARNSPFAKQTFITAQQQMLGFGVAAKDVIPALDAIQNAVAAMGGSNEQISAISEIMSRIKSEARRSGDALQRLGYYGIDAATIIGSQMGKTSAEIRDMARKPGGIPVDQVWEPLVTGLQEKFGGAAANVKNTFAGSIDRVKAAWRDFASELARPLVDPNGGGALVDLLNWAADAMRAFEDLPGPVKTTVSAVTGLVGAGSLAAGTFMLALPKVLEFQDALASLGGVAGIAKGGLSQVVSFLTSPWVLGLSAAAASVALFNAAMENSKVSSGQMSAAIKQGTSALDEMRATAQANEQGLGKLFVDLESKLEDLPALFERTEGAARGFWANNWNDSAALDSIEVLGRELASLATENLPAAQSAFKRFADEGGLSAKDALYALNTHMPTLKEQLLDAASAAGVATDDSTLLSIAMGEIDVAAEASKNSLEGIAGAAVDTTEAISKLAEEILGFGSAQINADRAAIDLRSKLDDLNKILNDGAGSLDIYTDAGRKTESAILDVAEAAKKNASAILEATGNEEESNAVLDEARQKLIEQRIALGDNADAAEEWASRRVPTAEQVKTALEGVSEAANEIPQDTAANVTTDADGATGKLKDTKGAQDAIKPTVTTKVTADTSGAIGPLQEVTAWLAKVALGAVAPITTSGGSTGGGSAGGGGTGGSSGGRANGGTIGFAQGGTIPGYAGGDTVGFGGGVRNGTVWGQGTAKSDSINVNLSRGEEVIQEPYASLHRPLLKAINRGDFVAGSQPAQRTIVVREVGDVYVQNPFSGEYLLSRVDRVANAAIDGFAKEQAQASRTARR